MKRVLVPIGLFLAAGCGAALAQSGSGEGQLVERLYGPLAPLVWAIAAVLMQLGMIALVAAPFQMLFPGVRREPKIRSYEFWLDILYHCQVLWLTPLAFFLAVDWLVDTVYRDEHPWWAALAGLPYWAQVAIAVWAFDFLVYWRHRWEHELAPLWSFHAVHHTAEKIDFLTTTRLHPFEIALGALFNAAVVKLGISTSAAAVGFAIYLYYNYFIHTNVRIRFPGLLKYVLVSPFMHQWHHAKDAVAAGKNLGVIFAWNDWLFRTAHHPDDWPTEFGLAAPEPERVGQSYVRQVLYPLQFLLARVAAWRQARPA